MKLSYPSPEFDDVVAGVCHGLATEAEMRALNELLRSDPRALAEYLMRTELHARLASAPDLFCEATNSEGEAAVPGPGLEHEGDALSAGGTISIRKKTLARVLAMAACLAFAAVAVCIFWLRGSATQRGATSNAVAMLARVANAHWMGSATPRTGSALEPGWLRLESGMAQVVFYSGARLVMEGPAELQIVSSTEARCSHGRLLAEVPRLARGFRVETGQLNVTDLGTAFGVDATEGRTEVHVFKGEVEFSSKTSSNQALVEGRAALAEGNGPPRLMAANAGVFTAMFDLQKRSLAAEAVRYDQWRVSNSRLNQDPTLLVHLDFENLGDSDWDLRNAAEKKPAMTDATIIGCQHAEGRWPEKPALEFQSVNDRVRLDVPGRFDSLTLSAWVSVKGLDRQFNSLFMCDGLQEGTIHWLIRNDGVLSLMVKGPGTGYQIAASAPVLTLDKFGTWVHLAVVIDGKARQVVHYVNGFPVVRKELKLGPPFRLGSAELGNWDAQAGPDPGPALIRNLGGAIDEFSLFSRALTDREIQQLYDEGRPQPDF
jgi:hypothetical protein